MGFYKWGFLVEVGRGGFSIGSGIYRLFFIDGESEVYRGELIVFRLFRVRIRI